MIRQKPEKPKRPGTAFWLADDEGHLLRALAAAEERTYQTIISRALRRYAAESPEYLKEMDRRDIIGAQSPQSPQAAVSGR